MDPLAHSKVCLPYNIDAGVGYGYCDLKTIKILLFLLKHLEIPLFVELVNCHCVLCNLRFDIF